MSNTTFDTQSFFKKLGLPGIIALASCLLLILSAFPPLAHLYVGFDSGIHMSDFDFPEFKQFFMALVEVAPCGLFVAYLLFFREKSNLAIMFPIIFFAIAFSASVDFFNTVHYISEGYYVLMYFSAPADVPAELERNYRISDDVMRYIVINLDKE